MARLEDLTPGTSVQGVLPGTSVSVVSVQWIGTQAIELTYKGPDGKVGNQLLYRDNEPSLDVASRGRAWSFDADGGLFRLVSEAYRIRLAYLFDPLLAVHTSLVMPLPHQITAVYEEMLPRQPLRYLLADDPGSGKTIMAGLLFRELQARGDLQRCMVVCPGMLAEQWQDELGSKFHLDFEILTNDKVEAARSGNWFQENDHVICRLDKLSRDEKLHPKLDQTDWDLIVVDEAHKMSATYFGGEARYTKRYRLGERLGKLTRNLLLLTATPHNGKEEDFQLFLALLDSDRFAGKYRDSTHVVDTSDLMRRLVKEQLLKFDGKPLFPERRAYTVTYDLSDPEAVLYQRVTAYVREEFNRAEQLENDGRKGTVGFALTTLQRRLASSPEAIYQSLRRRHERLERRLEEMKLLKRGLDAAEAPEKTPELPELTEDDLEDLDDAPDAEVEDLEDRVVDQATASRTIAELAAEIATLQELETLAHTVRRSERDKKWEELRELLLEAEPMFDTGGNRRKLVIFTEHKDTLHYLLERIRSLLGSHEAVVTIHGGIHREERRKVQAAFTQDRDVHILVATDAAGEGINLQRAHLMVNYDLPWNPNRLEQRFGRIHRIGQTEVCHLWNLVAKETREGDVFQRLLEKLETERAALGGAVYDVLGRVFQGSSLRKLLLEAIRYGDRPDVRNRLDEVIDRDLDREHLRDLIEEKALVHDSMDARAVQRIREDMERAETRRLQPHFIASFFIEAFRGLGGTIHEREPRRYEITHVPGAVRSRDRLIGTREPVLPRYERVTFHKDLISQGGKPMAAFVCPGHPLLDSVTDLVLERNRELLKRGAVLVDPNDPGTEPRVLVYLEHSIQDARKDRQGERRVISRRLQFLEIDTEGNTRAGGAAPFLDYRPVAEQEVGTVRPLLDGEWGGSDFESQVMQFAVEHLVPEHLGEVRSRREDHVSRTLAAVRDRLMKEIQYWDHRTEDLKAQEQAGKQPRMNWMKARERADDLQARLQRRTQELEEERRIAPLPPVVMGAALIVPVGMLVSEKGAPQTFAKETREVELRAMAEVMRAERELGYEPKDVSAAKCGWDIESKDPASGHLRFIEVKGRVKGARTVTISKNEILSALNQPDQHILAIVTVDGDQTECRYVRETFEREPDFGVTSVNYDLPKLWKKGGVPS